MNSILFHRTMKQSFLGLLVKVPVLRREKEEIEIEREKERERERERDEREGYEKYRDGHRSR